MIDINEFQITYMGKSCTIGDYIKYHKDISKCKQLQKVGALVYIKSLVENINIQKKEFCFDSIIEYLHFNIDECNQLAIKVILEYKIKKVPVYLKEIFESKDDDQKCDLFVKFLRDCGIN